MNDPAREQPSAPVQYEFRHRNRVAVHCYYCGCETQNATHGRNAVGERIRICRKLECRSKVAR